MMILGVDGETTPKPKPKPKPKPGGVVGYAGAPSLEKAREASISMSRSKLDKVSGVVLPSCRLSTVSTLVLERERLDGDVWMFERIWFVEGFGRFVGVVGVVGVAGFKVGEGEVDVEVCEVNVGEVNVFEIKGGKVFEVEIIRGSGGGGGEVVGDVVTVGDICEV